MFCVVIRGVGLLRYLWNLFLLVSLVSFSSFALGIVKSIMGSGGGELSAMGSGVLGRKKSVMRLSLLFVRADNMMISRDGRVVRFVWLFLALPESRAWVIPRISVLISVSVFSHFFFCTV